MTTPHDPNQLVTMRMLAQAMQAVAETDARMVMAQDDARQAIEDHRSRRRNRNRVLMILVAWAASLSVPFLATHVFHMPALVGYAAAIGFSGDLLVTGYSWWRNY